MIFTFISYIPNLTKYKEKHIMNIVQFGGKVMNKTITSRDAILKVAKEIAYKEGISKLNIRGVASACGVSVGSIYNYFPTKGDLIIVVIEEFWKDIFERGMCNHHNEVCFIQFFQEIYIRFYDYLKIFKEDLLNQISFLSKSEREKGRVLESQYLNGIRGVMLFHLEKDQGINNEIWTEDFTKEKFVDFMFQNMFSMLKSNESDISFFKEIIIKLLY